ncbi:hypothetical protein VUR80DRAFT_4304 [Thermomyces stellatus]
MLETRSLRPWRDLSFPACQLCREMGHHRGLRRGWLWTRKGKPYGGMQSLRGRAVEVPPPEAVIELGAPDQLHKDQNPKNKRPRPVGATTSRLRRPADAAALARRRAAAVHGVPAARKTAREAGGNAGESGVSPSIVGAMRPLWHGEVLPDGSRV